MTYMIGTTGMNLISILGLTAHERLNALQSMSNKKPGSNNGLIWLLVMIGIIVLTIIIAKLAHVWKHKAEGFANWTLFNSRTKELELNQDEVAILTRMVKLMHLNHDPHSVLTLESDFRNGARTCLEIDFDDYSSDREKSEYERKIDLLRAKLGFGPSAFGGQSSSRQIRGGTNVTVTIEGRDGEFAATVQKCDMQDLVVKLELAMSCSPGDKWHVRFTDDKSMWDFETSVIDQEDDLVFLAHAEKMQFINLRKFERALVQQRAIIGKFPFQTKNIRATQPDFVEASIVEISGPSIRLKMPQALHHGERLLVILEIKLRQIIQAVGIIKHSYASDGIHKEYGVELLGLSSNELAQLARITKQAADKNRRQNSDAEWKEDNAVLA